jgi:hypothetical protein
MAITTFTDTDYAALFKRTYGEYGDNLYGSGIEDPLESQLDKVFDFGGVDHRFAVKIGFGGGTGFGVLPTANKSKNLEVVLTRKAAYARLNLDRQTILASRGKAAAFKEATSEETEGKLKSFNRTQACALYNDGTAILGQTSGSAGGTAAVSTCVILNTGTYQFRQGYFEEGDYVNFVVSGTTLLSSVWEITTVVISTRTITLTRVSGSDNLTTVGAGTHNIVLQSSNGAVSPMGVKGVCDFTSGTLYSVTFQRRWAAFQNTLATPSLISVDLLNQAMLQIDARSGESPNLIVMSIVQMNKFLNQLEDKKRYTQPMELGGKQNAMTTKATAAFSAIEYMSIRGAVPIVSSRYVRDDTVYLLNTNKMFRKHVERFGWFDDDGTVLLRMQDQDAYEARFGGYYENFINPLYQGKIDNLVAP